VDFETTISSPEFLSEDDDDDPSEINNFYGQNGSQGFSWFPHTCHWISMSTPRISFFPLLLSLIPPAP
jgi:hypothetical protein